MTLSKNKIKYINQLSTKKWRDQENVFIAEGTKLVTDLATSLRPLLIVAQKEWADTHHIDADEIIITDKPSDIKSISKLTTPPPVIAIFPQPKPCNIEQLITQKQLILVLDTIQDPGNMGTIIRTADWFGIKHIICSKETADIYNPKVIQSTMGAIARVQVHYTTLTDTLPLFINNNWSIYGTFLDGNNIYTSPLSEFGLIVMGNEGNGISDHVAHLVSHRLLIPRHSTDTETVESLNVSVATAIVCSEFRRKQLQY